MVFSSFLKLPREIRNHIYDFVVDDDYQVDFVFMDKDLVPKMDYMEYLKKHPLNEDMEKLSLDVSEKASSKKEEATTMDGNENDEDYEVEVKRELLTNNDFPYGCSKFLEGTFDMGAILYTVEEFTFMNLLSPVTIATYHFPEKFHAINRVFDGRNQLSLVCEEKGLEDQNPGKPRS